MAITDTSVFSALTEETPFVHRVSQPTGRDRAFPYTGDYMINRSVRDVLVELIKADPESQA
jgi:hypothetical protein